MWQCGACAFTCWKRKATNTHLEYGILISFPQQRWLHEFAWELLYTYIACLVELYMPVSATSATTWSFQLPELHVKDCRYRKCTAVRNSFHLFLENHIVTRGASQGLNSVTLTIVNRVTMTAMDLLLWNIVDAFVRRCQSLSGHWLMPLCRCVSHFLLFFFRWCWHWPMFVMINCELQAEAIMMYFKKLVACSVNK